MTDVVRKRKGTGWVLPRGVDRPIVGVVGLDPARTGPGGLCVMPNPELKPGRQLVWRQGQIVEAATARWLGESCAALCRPGERLLLVAESDAFGPSVARLLGMAVGAIELHLVCLNAVEPESRVDVSQATWRRAVLIGDAPDQLRKLPKGRKALKDAARREVRRRYGLEMPADAAEATLVAAYGVGLLLDHETTTDSET